MVEFILKQLGQWSLISLTTKGTGIALPSMMSGFYPLVTECCTRNDACMRWVYNTISTVDTLLCQTDRIDPSLREAIPLRLLWARSVDQLLIRLARFHSCVLYQYHLPNPNVGGELILKLKFLKP